jgi:hypothetical protein
VVRPSPQSNPKQVPGWRCDAAPDDLTHARMRRSPTARRSSSFSRSRRARGRRNGSGHETEARPDQHARQDLRRDTAALRARGIDVQLDRGDYVLLVVGSAVRKRWPLPGTDRWSPELDAAPADR